MWLHCLAEISCDVLEKDIEQMEAYVAPKNLYVPFSVSGVSQMCELPTSRTLIHPQTNTDAGV